MTNTVLVAGTASHVGKSTIVTGLCRLLDRRDVSVAPFKAQNMSNNARVALTPDGSWGEIGVSQYVQARAAGVTPTTDMNPVLLKPRGEGESQLVVHGESRAHHSPDAYYQEQWEAARSAAIESYERLATKYDIVIAEGAGSIAEINLHDRDLANIETARFTDADVLLVVDIERGGAFASLLGTLELVPSDVRERVIGAVITKFRGEESLLAPAIDSIESRTGVPILGVLPYDDPGLPAEDSVSLPEETTRAIEGDTDGIPDEQSVTIGVPRFPRLSNAPDLEPLQREPGVRVAYLPIDGGLGAVDAVVLPGTKNTVDDLLMLSQSKMAADIQHFNGPIVGICGGYQMLGNRITNAGIESTRAIETVEGLGLLPVETQFSTEKQVHRVTRTIEGVGPLAGASGQVQGYEIHMGESTVIGDVSRPVGPDSAGTDRVLGTYLHGLFENECARSAFLDNLYGLTSQDRPTARQNDSASFDLAADLINCHVDLGPCSVLNAF